MAPFYALAQRCRLSGGMPDMVLHVLNTYRAMASPGALSPAAPRCVGWIECCGNWVGPRCHDGVCS